jgi:hypothetical protein
VDPEEREHVGIGWDVAGTIDATGPEAHQRLEAGGLRGRLVLVP